MDLTSYRKQAGLTLVEAIVWLAIAIILSAGALAGVLRYMDGLDAQGAATQALDVQTAAEAYIADNRQSILATATPTNAYTANMTALVAGGYLPPGFPATNAFGQTYLIQAIEPTPGQLQAIVKTTGGRAIPGTIASRVAQLIGSQGASIVGNNAGARAVGAHGMWEISLNPFTGSENGRLVVSLFDLEQEPPVDTYLHRAAQTGKPELNRMSTTIDMAAHDVASANLVRANEVHGQLNHTEGLLTIGSGAPAYGTGSANVYWTDNTRTFELRGSNPNQRANAEVRNLAADNEATVAGELMTNADVTATNMAVGQNLSNLNGVSVGGDIASQGALMLGQGGWSMNNTLWMRSQSGAGIVTGGTLMGGSTHALGDLSASTTIQAGGRVVSGEYMLPRGTAVCETACPTNGLLAQSTNGGGLTACVNNVWKCVRTTSTDSGIDPVTPGPSLPTQGCLPSYPPTGCPVGYQPIRGGCEQQHSPFLQMVCP